MKKILPKTDRQQPNLNVVKGVVTQTGKNLSTIQGHQGHDITVTSVSELWLTDVSGKETRFSSSLMSEAREGHEIAVVVAGSEPMPVALINLTSDQVFVLGESSLIESFGSRLINLFVLGLVTAVGLLLLYLGVGDSIVSLFEPFYQDRRAATKALLAFFPYIWVGVVALIGVFLFKQYGDDVQYVASIKARVNAELRTLGRNADGSRIGAGV